MKFVDIADAVRQRLLHHSDVLKKQASIVLENANDRFLRLNDITLANKSPYEIVHDNGLVKVRHYLSHDEDYVYADGEHLKPTAHKHRVPVVIVPPLAVNMLTYDLFPERSLVKYLMARGFSVYLIDWGKPGRRHAHYNLQTYVVDFMPDMLAYIRRHAGVDDLSLHGWSLGGTMSLAYAAHSRDAHIRNVVILGTPVDSHASGSLGKMYQRLSQQAEWVRRNTGFRIHNLSPKLMHTPGWVNTVSFKMLSPMASLMGYWELLTKLGDRDFVINHATNASFLNHMVAYPGGVVQDMMIRIWIDNEMAAGRFPIGEDIADLKHIKASVLAFAGRSDTMVTADAVRPLVRLVGSDDAQFHVISGGHMGILSGSKAPSEAWPLMADWLAERSD